MLRHISFIFILATVVHSRPIDTENEEDGLETAIEMTDEEYLEVKRNFPHIYGDIVTHNKFYIPLVDDRVTEFYSQLQDIELLDIGEFIRDFFDDSLEVQYTEKRYRTRATTKTKGMEAIYVINDLLSNYLADRYLYALNDFQVIKTSVFDDSNGDRIYREEGYLMNRVDLKELEETHYSIKRDWKMMDSGLKIVRLECELTNSQLLQGLANKLDKLQTKKNDKYERDQKLKNAMDKLTTPAPVTTAVPTPAEDPVTSPIPETTPVPVTAPEGAPVPSQYPVQDASTVAPVPKPAPIHAPALVDAPEPEQ